MQFKEIVKRINDWAEDHPTIRWPASDYRFKEYDNPTSASMTPVYDGRALRFAMIEIEVEHEGGRGSAAVDISVTDRGHLHMEIDPPVLEMNASNLEGFNTDSPGEDEELTFLAIEEVAGAKRGGAVEFDKQDILRFIAEGVLHPETPLQYIPGQDFDYDNEDAVRYAVEIAARRRAPSPVPVTPPNATVHVEEREASGKVLGHEMTEADVDRIVAIVMGR